MENLQTKVFSLARKLLLSAVLLLLPALAQAEISDDYVHVTTTWSIVGRDAATGTLFAASSSKYFNVIHRICRVRAATGIVISKARGNPRYFRALEMIERGQSATDALSFLLRNDTQIRDGKEVNLSSTRQVAVIDQNGAIAVHTGADCGKVAQHIVHPEHEYVILGNGLENSEVLPAIEQAYLKATGPWYQRASAAMEAGYQAGGEVRPESSAGFCYAPAEKKGAWWHDSGEFVSVADSTNPIVELSRMFALEQSRRLLEKGFAYFETGEIDQGNRAFEKAIQLNPDDVEIPLWQGYFLYQAGRKKQALELLRPIVPEAGQWTAETLSRFGGRDGRQLLDELADK